jgi:hypothetical protein
LLRKQLSPEEMEDLENKGTPRDLLDHFSQLQEALDQANNSLLGLHGDIGSQWSALVEDVRWLGRCEMA